MRKLGDQWIEVVDSKNHMVKAVELLSIYDGKSINGRTCHGCSFVDEWDDDCTLKNPPCRISEHKAGPFIIKDLGILNEDGCLPNGWGEYPKIERSIDVGTGIKWYRCITRNDVYCATNSYATEREAIGAWNRRV